MIHNTQDKNQAAEERNQDTQRFVRQVRLATPRKYTTQEKIHIVLEGHAGLRFSTSGSGSDRVSGTVNGLTIEHGEPAAETDLATAWGVNNTVLLELEDRIYITETGAGTVSVSDDSGSDFQIVGTPAEFMEENTNFDISAALLHFIGDDDDVDDED